MDNLGPVVSVIIPCFNQGATLDEAVASVLDQTFTDFEIVIVNDGSTEPFTSELLANYHRPRTRVITTANGGLAAARNTAIRNSRGKYILPLDADDRIAPEYLERAVPVLEASADVLIVHCDVERFGDETGLVQRPKFSRRMMLFRNLIFCASFFRRSDYDEIGGYKDNVHAHEDWDLWLSLLELRPAGRVVQLSETLFYYRIHSSSMMASVVEADRRHAQTNLYLNHTALYEAHGVDPIALYGDVEQLEARSMRLESEYREIRGSAETFDDGYRDNFLNAKPLLEQRDVPATLFLTSDYIESRQEFWWDEMERILSKGTLSPAAFDSVYRRLQAMIDVDRRAALDRLCETDGIAGDVSVAHPILSRDEVAAFDKSDLVEVCSHTATHPLLTALSLHQQQEEIVRGKRQLEEIVGHPVVSFAYPNGRYNAVTMKLVEEAGFACGCSTDAGIVTPEADRFCLPRIQVPDCDGEEFARRLSEWFER